MTALDDAFTDFAARFGDRLRLTEYRQIELYTKKRKLAFAAPEAKPPLPPLLGALTAFGLLDAHLEAADEAQEGRTGWQRYQALPRATGTEKLVAEVYRILRVLRAAAVHRSGRLELTDGILVARATVNRTALALHISTAGPALLEAFVAAYLGSLRQPYGEGYVEALLGAYFADIIGEIKRFADEDRILYQYRQRLAFNRHARFDCDNPKFRIEDGRVLFEIGERYADPARHPIDFFVVIDDVLHIVPVEALAGGAIALDDLPRWRARVADGPTLPAAFRQRFGRETMTPGLPMW